MFRQCSYKRLQVKNAEIAPIEVMQTIMYIISNVAIPAVMAIATTMAIFITVIINNLSEFRINTI